MAARSIPERPEHRLVVAFLEALAGPLLEDHGVVFAGGTRIALAYGEYRVSRDADFLATDRAGYASLRAHVRNRGVSSLLAAGAEVELPREARIDQYGIRFPALIEGQTLKVEFVAEGRIELDAGSPGLYSTVPWASITDCFAEKLLASSDRWADDAYLSRDLIDLAVLGLHEGPIPASAWNKAEGAYGKTVVLDLEKAAERFLERDDHRKRCFEHLDVRNADAILESVKYLLEQAAQRAR